MAKLCFGCMRQKAESPVCEHCGFDENKNNLVHQLPIGTMLQGKYLIGRVLGQGGFGITYIGWDQHLSMPVAIKEYYPQGAVQRNNKWGNEVICASGEAPELFEKHKEKFLKEARTLAHLAGIPEIVQIRNYFSENGTAYIVMEYVQGITMKTRLKQLGRPMTEAEVLSVMEPVFPALQKVHEQNLIHRDISPDNMMLPTGGGVKLIDFGTVRYTDNSGASKSTEAVLKPGFAPMEQYNTRGNLGAWTDVYALCATVHYLLTGKVPPDVHERMDEGEELVLLRQNPDISRKLIRVLEKGMKIRAAERIQSVAQLQHMLYAEDEEQPAQPSGKQVKAAPKAAASDRKSPVKRFLPLVAVLILAAAAFVLIPGQKPEEIPQTTVPLMETVPLPEDTRDPREAQYVRAMALLEEGKYEQAIAAFSALEDYRDSRKMAEDSVRGMEYAEAENLLTSGEAFRAAKAFYALGDYRDARQRCFAVWDTITRRETVSANMHHVVALRNDGTVVAVSINDGEHCRVESWTDIVAVSAGRDHTVGLKSDGTVVAVGDNTYGQCDVDGWTDIVAISADWQHTVGLRANGTVVATGNNGADNPNPLNRCNVGGWVDIVAISTNEHQTMGLCANGTVVTTGSPNWNQANLSGWREIAAIDAANWSAIGLRTDGTAVCSGINDWRQCNVEGWTDLVAVSGGIRHTVGLKSDGTVVAIGSNKDYFDNTCGQCNVEDWTDIVWIETGHNFTLGLKSDGTLVATGQYVNDMHAMFSWSDIKIPK